MGNDEIVHAIADEVERYLSVNPEAADSPQGIQGFWLSADLRSEPIECVIAALDELRRRGLVSKTEIDGVGPVYAGAVRATGPGKP